MLGLFIPRTIEYSLPKGDAPPQEQESTIAQNQIMEELPLGSVLSEGILPDTDLATSSQEQSPGANSEGVASSSIFCKCVSTARAEGVDIPLVSDASELLPNSEPRIGGLVLFDYGEVSHVAVIKGFRDEGVFVTEGNWKHCEKTERVVAWGDPNIKGFWHPDNGKTITAEISMYTASPEETDANPTEMANGEEVFDGAVANNCLPFGTQVVIEDKMYEVTDRMNKRYGCNHFDIYVPFKAIALNFGRKVMPVKILD